MQNCQDWEEIKARYSDFWDGKYHGNRPLIHLRAKKGSDAPIWYKGDIVALNHGCTDLNNFYTNEAVVLERHRNYIRNTQYFGEAFPSAVVNLGPGVLAACLGAKVKLMEDSIWFDEYIDEWDEDFVPFSQDNPWWKKTLLLTKVLAENAGGDYMVGVADLNSVSNAMSLIRGSEKLAMDLLLEPEAVVKYRDIILKTWFYCQKELYKVAQQHQSGYTDWMGMWAPDLGVAVQCDFSTLISTDMFKEFFWEELCAQCEKIPYPIYHLDGPDCIRHLDEILKIPKLRAVQWQPGAGAPPACDPCWQEMLKKIQNSGKNLYVYAKMDEVKLLAQSLDNDRLFIYVTEYAPDGETAQSLIQSICR